MAAQMKVDAVGISPRSPRVVIERVAIEHAKLDVGGFDEVDAQPRSERGAIEGRAGVQRVDGHERWPSEGAVQERAAGLGAGELGVSEQLSGAQRATVV